MLVFNDSPFKIGTLLGRVPPMKLTATCVVKATYRLAPGGAAAPCPDEEQINLDGDQFGPAGPADGLRYSSDFAPWKPGADLLLAGSAFAPKGKAATSVDVRFGVGAWSKTLRVFGDRFWKAGLLGSSLSEPIPFTRMPITWARAHGGANYKPNPVGRGVGETELPDGLRARLGANVESATRAGEPAGFAPIDPSWPQRMGKVGTYGSAWQRKNWPWFPDDFDWTFFNAAPPDQQWPNRYLAGDETITLQNLHPTIETYTCRLPGAVPRWFSHVRQGTQLVFRQVPLSLDTLFVDPEAETLVLVWRGITEAVTWKLTEFEEHYVIVEPPATRRSLEDYRTQCLARKEAELRAMEVEPVLLEPVALPAPEVPDLSWVGPFEKKVAAAQAGPKPFDPMTQHGWAGSPAATRPLMPAPPPPPPPPATLDDAARMMKKDWATIAASEPGFAKGIEAPPDLSGLKADEAELAKAFPPAQATPPPDAQGEPSWDRARVEAHVAKDGHFEGEDLSGLDLSGLDLRGRRFVQAVLHETSLAGCTLEGCDFTRASLAAAKLEGASLKKAVFVEADLAGAAGKGVDFSGAVLDGADFSQAQLPQSVFTGARAKMPIFASADLTAARFDGAQFQQADFTAAQLQRSVLTKAALPDAGLYEVQASEADFRDAQMERARCSQGDFTKAKFLNARAPESVWDESVVEEADFTGATLPQANFSNAQASRAVFTAARLPQAKFEDCRAPHAMFFRANLFRATFEGADLTSAILASSNLFEAEFFRAILDKADLNNANVRRTKLA